MSLANRLCSRLYRLGEWLHGWNALERLRQLEAMERWPAEHLRAFQTERLKLLLRHAYDHVPFYRALWDRAGVHPAQVEGLEDLARFPVVTKEMLRTAGDSALDSTQPKARFVQGQQQRLNGARFVYYKTREHQSWLLASHFQGWGWAGWHLGDRWIRLQHLGSLSLHARLENRVFRCLYMPLDRLDADFMGRFADQAALRRGDAAELSGRGVRVRAVPPGTGRRAAPSQGRRLHGRHALPALPRGHHEGLRVPDLRHLRRRGDGRGQSVRGRLLSPPAPRPRRAGAARPRIGAGRPGSPRADEPDQHGDAPGALRHRRRGDRRLGGLPVRANGPVLKQIVGRETDIVVTPAGRHLLCHHFNNALRGFDSVDQFQVLQRVPERITVRLVTNGSYARERDERLVVGALSRLGGEGFGVEVEYVDAIPVPPTGKRRYIISTAAASRG